MLAALLQLRENAGIDVLLRIDKSLQVKWIVHVLPWPVARDWPQSSPIPRLTRNTCPSGWRNYMSRTFHAMLVGGNVTSSPAATHAVCTASTSSTQTDIQTPLSSA